MSDQFFSFTVMGLEDLRANFDTLDKDMQRKFARKALRAGVAPIKAAILAELAPHRKSGLLEESLAVNAGRGDRPGNTSMLIRYVTTVGEFLERGVSGEKERSRLQGLLATKYKSNPDSRYLAYYARFLEFGHKPSGMFSHMTEDVPAYPVSRSGFDASVDTAADIIEDVLASQVTQES